MLPSGRKVGGYRIESYVARGGFSEVYKARSIRDGSLSALKVLSLTLPEELMAAERHGALLQQRFEEACGMVPRTFEVDHDDDYFFISMAFIEGPGLDAEIARGPIDPVRAAQHAVRMCCFLERAHRFATTIDGVSYEKIIHADLKPSHIFVDGVDRLTVLDFGIAKALEKSRTAKTIRFVTPLYASPQRLQTGRGSEQDDLWAVAVMLYEMVRGKRPHSAIEDPPTYARLSRAIEIGAQRESLPASCPRELAAIIDKGLRFQEELRYESAEVMRADLEVFLRGGRPGAIAGFDIPPTIKVEPQPLATVGSGPAIATLPRPAAVAFDLPAAAGVAVALPQAPPARVAIRQPGILRRAAWIAMLGFVTMLFTSEALAWLNVERLRAGLATLDVGGVARAHELYDQQRRMSFLHIGQHLRLDRALRTRLISAADAVLADYRHDDASVTEGQWRRASDALEWASELAPRDISLEPTQLVSKGHLDRIAAQVRAKTNSVEAQELYQRAIDQFERAASLDTRAPDPYLGLSRVYIYGKKDVDRGADAIRAAEMRGYTSGWRDRALLADGYRQRADDGRRNATHLADEARSAILQNAREDYARCVAMLTPIVDKGNWKYNLGYCQRHLDVLSRDLDAVSWDGR
jgi:eukaryotic-like serine/threonine-protein kinase